MEEVTPCRSHPPSQRLGAIVGEGVQHRQRPRTQRALDRVAVGGRVLLGSAPQSPEVGRAGCIRERALSPHLRPWTQGRRRGQRQGLGRLCTHTCADPGSCSGRPGAGPVGSGSSGDRPAWLSWGPAVGHTVQQGPCEEGDGMLVTRAAPCPPPMCPCWQLLPAASPLPGRTSETFKADAPFPLSDRGGH